MNEIRREGLTPKKALDQANLLSNGVKPDDEINYDYKVGEIRSCHKCNEPTELIDFDNSLSWWDQVLVTCLDCYEPLLLNDNKFEKREKEIHDIRLKCREIVELVKPNDSYLDWTKVKYVAGNSYFYTNAPDKWLFWLEDAYKLYIAVNKK